MKTNRSKSLNAVNLAADSASVLLAGKNQSLRKLPKITAAERPAIEAGATAFVVDARSSSNGRVDSRSLLR
jgi:hypothetical protein